MTRAKKKWMRRLEGKIGCPTLATLLFLWLGWDGRCSHYSESENAPALPRRRKCGAASNQKPSRGFGIHSRPRSRSNDVRGSGAYPRLIAPYSTEKYSQAIHSIGDERVKQYPPPVFGPFCSFSAIATFSLHAIAWGFRLQLNLRCSRRARRPASA